MISGLCDLMNNLKLQASLVKDWDETLGMEASSVIPYSTPAFGSNAPVMQFNSFETWNLWPEFNTSDNPISTQNPSEWNMQSTNCIKNTLLFP
ncbi:uncharacterized protein N7484_005411 [Penicillium longicatenatum]|uniref:uncharacterized protein n=1 Tax=Penicillium longicatenatum TaxID=1561947 RepID=UPI00254828D4|nr:uncharacterized protein N7484_005411 [Penicillium longicatenatum]KAJ5642904.1 hypothetical protein N7484_005411 [Penicillium longicatenatum]